MKVKIEIAGKRMQANILAGALNDFLKKELTDTESYPEETKWDIQVTHTVLRGRSKRACEKGKAG